MSGTSRRVSARAFALVALTAILAIAGWQLAAGAAGNVSVTLTTSDTGLSDADDAIGFERSTFAQAQRAVNALPASNPSVTVPTRIKGFPDIGLTGVLIETDPDSRTIAMTGEATSIFGQEWIGGIDILVLFDWDDDDATDKEPRTIVSGQLADSTLGELIGLDDGSIVSELPLPVGALTVSNRRDASIPAGDDDLLDPTSFPPNAQAFFTRIDGSSLRDQLPLRGNINFQTAINIGAVDQAINDALGFARDERILVDGSVALDLENFPSAGAEAISGLSLAASNIPVNLPTAIRDAVGLTETDFRASFEVQTTDSGTPADPSDDSVRAAFAIDIDLGSPLPDATAELAVEIVTTGADEQSVLLSAAIQDWDDAFGVSWLDLTEVRLSGLFESTGGGVPDVTVSLDAQTVIADKEVAVSIEGELQSPLNASMNLELNDTISLDEALKALNVRRSSIPAHVRESTFGPASFAIDLATEGVGPTVVTVSAAADLGFQMQPQPANPIAASIFFEFVAGDTADVTMGIRPNGELKLSDLVAGATPDLTLVSEDTNFGFVASSAEFASSIDDMSNPAAAFFGPLVPEGDDVELPAGFSVLGVVDLPESLAELVGNSLGMQSTVAVSGSLPIGDGGPGLDLTLGLDLDPEKTPDWIHAGSLDLMMSARGGGVSVSLEGSLTTKFRSGVDPATAAQLGSIGLDVYADVPVSPGFDCPGGAQVQAIATPAGTEHRCYDLLTFSVSVGVDVTSAPPSASLSTTLRLSTPDPNGWNPFGLTWLSIKNLALKLELNWDSAAPPPGVNIGIGFLGDVDIAGKDLTAAAKVSVQPVPYPPFVIIKPEGFRLASSAGFELADFFDLQHTIAETAATVRGDDPNAVAGPFNPSDLGIPNIGLKNLEFSFALEGDADLCLPQGLFISADIYVDAPAGFTPDSSGPRCSEDGAPLPPTPGARTCGDYADQGCIAGGRLAVSDAGFELLAEINAWELGPLEFDDAKLDIKLTEDEQHFIMFGGVAFDPIGFGQMQMSLARPSGAVGITASFAGRLGIGPKDSPYFEALAEGSVAFDLADIKSSGINLRVVLSAAGLDVGDLALDFAEDARTAIETTTDDILAVLDLVDAQLTLFQNDPAGYVRTGLRDAGVTVPPELQPLIDQLADLVGAGTVVAEGAILRGELPGAPTGGRDPVFTCFGVSLIPVAEGGRCYDILPDPDGAPNGGAAKSCPLDTPQPQGGRCYTLLPDSDGEPSGGAAKSCPLDTPQSQGGRCYTLLPSAGVPSGGIAPAVILGNLVCPPTHPFLRGGRCYTIPPNNGTPSGGNPPVCVAPFIFESGGRCYIIPPNNGTPSGGNPPVCVVPFIFEVSGRCYTVPPNDGTPSGGRAPVESCLLESVVPVAVDGRCYDFPPVDLEFGLCSAFGLDPNCTRTQFKDAVIKPAIIAASEFTADAIDEAANIVDALDDAFGLECAEFELVLNGSEQSVSVSITVKILGDIKTLTLEWDLAKPLVDNLKGLYDGMTGASGGGCAPIEWNDFADEVLGEDGGGSIKPPTGVLDTTSVYEGQVVSFNPLANDIDAGEAVISRISNFGGGLPVNATIEDTQRSVSLDTTAVNLPGGASQLAVFRYGVTNSNGADNDFIELSVLGVNDPPITEPDVTSMGSRDSASASVIDNDVDPEGASLRVVGVDSRAGGCATFDASSVTLSRFDCAGRDAYEFISTGYVYGDEVSYTVEDADGAQTSGTMTVWIDGINQLPEIRDLRTSYEITEPGVEFSLLGEAFDINRNDITLVDVDWGDGSPTESINLAAGGTDRFQFAHSYANAGTYRITVGAFDGHSLSGAAASTTVYVRGDALFTVTDLDEDGAPAGVDCDDNEPLAYPGNTEVLGDGIDNDCDGQVDEEPMVFCSGLEATIVADGSGPVVGTPAADVIVGTEGDDVINGAGGDDVICGLGGNDEIHGDEGADTLYGDGGDDTITGDDGDDTIFGGDGADKLFGFQGADTIDGGAGDDTLHGHRGNDVLSGGDDDDRIFGYAHDDVIDGGPGDDKLHGHFGNDTIIGGAGADRMFGYGDNDNLDGGDGDDLISGNFGDDVINGRAGNDLIFGADGDDTINGGLGDDELHGNSLNDTVNGNAGNDTIDGGIGRDTCNGGLGTDTAARCETLTGFPL